jgi:hypothetical protein
MGVLKVKVFRVGIFPFSSGIGQEIYNSLKYSKDFEIIAINSIMNTQLVDMNEFFLVPHYSSKNFISSMNKKLQSHNIDFLYPANDEILYFLAKNSEKLNTTIVTSPKETILSLLNKRLMYSKLFEKDLDFLPQQYFKEESLSFPLFIRPSFGHSSINAFKINDIHELDLALAKIGSNYLLTEFLPGEELTVDCYTNNVGILSLALPRKRVQIKNGITSIGEQSEITPDIFKMLDYINSKFIFSGAWFAQFKANKFNKFKLLEIGPRVAGSMGLSRIIGYNLCKLTLYEYFLKLNIEILNLTGFTDMKIRRINNTKTFYLSKYSFNTIYVDWDDTLSLNGDLNTELYYELIRLKSNGYKLIILSRNNNLNNNIDLKAIISIFDKIIWVKESNTKSSYIKIKKSIFIDDSFKERKEVYKACYIPCLDVNDAVEYLKGIKNENIKY